MQEKRISVEKAIYALKTAQSYYLPNVAFQAGYQSGYGGRSISFPVGDLLNPVYSTLNSLTASHNFPHINNVDMYFLPSDMYDAKVTTTMPLFNKDIGYGKKIQQTQLDLQKTDLDAYKRELVKQIKTAYYNYLLALRNKEIYQSSLEAAKEAKRTNEKLLENGKGLPAYVLRAESEVQQIEAQLNDAQMMAEKAQMYFNFLLNIPLNSVIDRDYNVDANMPGPMQPTTLMSMRGEREEVKQLQKVIEINNTVLKMNQNFWYPKVNAYLNLGAQAEYMKFTSKAPYYLGGVQVDIPIFGGRRNEYKTQMAKLDRQTASYNKELLEGQVELGVKIAMNDCTSAMLTYNASLKQLDAAAAYQRLVEKGYKEGVSTFIETIDAREQLIKAQLLVNINQFKVLLAYTELERETATYNINK